MMKGMNETCDAEICLARLKTSWNASVDASEVSFADSLDTTKSSTEEMYVQKMSSIEELEKSVGSCKNTIQANSQVITSLQNKIEEMKVEAAEKENAKKPKRASSKKKTK